jgi:protein O-GlcNAc transferase
LPQDQAALGLNYYRAGRYNEAAEAFYGLIRQRPRDAEGYYNLGLSLIGAGRFQEAVAACSDAVRLRPDHPDSWSNLGIPLFYLDRFADALTAYDSALRLRPDHGGAHGNRGNALYALGRQKEAERAFRTAIGLDPWNAEVWTSLGNLLKEQARHAEALAAYRAAQRAAPFHAPAGSNLVMALHYVAGISPAQILEEARAYAARFETPRRLPRSGLRIGYVSGDLRRHPVGYFLKPVLANHRMEAFCYSTNPKSDDMTAELKALATRWRDIAFIPDELAARIIAEDKIDILVDLSGHTAFNRLPLFARRAAPVQVSWLGFWGTTGLSNMDYAIADDMQAFYSEKLVRLPRRFCYAPPDYAPEPRRNPGPVRFGCFNNPSKIGSEVIDLWREFPMVLKWSGLQRERFPEYFELRGASPHAEMLAEYADIDVALDPFPFSGGVTTCEALWMGVPVVSLPGGSMVSRQSADILRSIGRPEWVAKSAEDYLRIARELAENPPDRKALRQQVADSPLCDGAGFTRDLEALFRQM